MPRQTNDQRQFAQAFACLQAGDLSGAEKLCQNLMNRHPDNSSLHDMLGLVQLKRGQHRAAAEQFRKALAGGPPEAGLYNNLALALTGDGRLNEAVEAARTAVQLRPDVAEFQTGLGNLLKKAGMIDAAKTAYRDAIALNPNLASAYVALGGLYASLGERDAAISQYQKALEVRPGYALAFYHLALLSKAGKTYVDQTTIDAFQRVAESESSNSSDSMLIQNALGFIADQRGEYDRAFTHFQSFNEGAKARQMARGQQYDRVAHSRLIDQIIEAFPPDTFDVHAPAVSNSRRPLFVIGMPRSGSTLVEQILGNHQVVAAGGEFREMDQISDAVPDYPAGVQGLLDSELRDLAARYLSVLTTIDDAADRVSDKLHRNYLHLGLVARLFPSATIVHCRRNPIDTCLSCYFQNFGVSNDFSNDLTDIGAYYLEYVRLMSHWKQVLPMDIVQVDYEDLVAHPEDTVRSLLDAIGLFWDSNCLNFTTNPRPILTASLWQVRQPITTRAVGRWRHYESHLGVLRRALGDI